MATGTVFDEHLKFNLSPSDGIAVLGLGDLPHPATCMKCGSGNYDGGYLSLGVYFDYEGQMLLCIPCFEQYAQFLGFISPDVAKLVDDQQREIAEHNARLRLELTDALGRLEVFTTALSGINSNPTGGTPDLGVPSSKDGEGELRTIGDGEQATSSPESESPESTTISGPGITGEPAVPDVTAPVRVRSRGKSSGPSL